MSRQLLNISKGGDSTTSLANLCQCSVTLTVKKCFLLFRGNLLSSSVCPLRLVLSLGTTEKSLALSSLHPPFRTTTPGETKLLASEVYDILQSSNMSDMDNVNEMNYRRRKAQFFLGSTNKRAKTVVLHIDGLDDSSRRNLCEEALLKIKGVISFTFQMAVQRCVVRIRSDLKAEALATAIASTKVMKAQQVVKSESGEEMLVPFQDTPVEVEQNTDLPEYLPEDESPTKEQDKAVSRVGSHPEGAASWLSTAANFLSRSFYW
ncbi:armadillo repeat-containing protein 1 isoform X2 [Calonectris borealis]|uniref:armadillo repeat-containing protein 1 isoform X2 n=1 Tax=Calonectris borealis TaxID=1323832 RepID=UPI003F4C9A11